MARTPDDFDPDELDARWDDLTSRLGPLRTPPEPQGPRDYEVTETDEGFEPPDPPFGNPDPATVLAWLALGVGLLAAVVGVTVGAPAWLAPLGVVLAAGGLITLFVRLPDHTELDDDGAQV